MISCDFRPLMLATKPTPHESCSLRGSYSPGPAGEPIIMVPTTASVARTWLDRPKAGRGRKRTCYLALCCGATTMERPAPASRRGPAGILVALKVLVESGHT